jgi:hypothetical protein
MKNKKGFLLGEETVKIIIAVVCIGFLVFLLIAIYMTSVNNGKLKQAQAILTDSPTGSIKVVIDRVRSGQGNIGGNSEELPLLSPQGWYLYSFVGGDKKPNSCLGKNCLCICDSVVVDTLFGLMNSRQLSECDNHGACLVVEDLENSPIKIKIESLTLLIKKQDNFIEVLQK